MYLYKYFIINMSRNLAKFYMCNEGFKFIYMINSEYIMYAIKGKY